MATSTRKKIRLHCGEAIKNLNMGQAQLATIAEKSADRSEVIDVHLPLIMASLQSVIEATEVMYYRL